MDKPDFFFEDFVREEAVTCLAAGMARQVHFLERAVSGKLSFEQICRVSNVRLDFEPFCCARFSEHTK